MSRKKEKWDGRSRPSDDLYRKRWNEIFGSREQDELNESYKQSLKNKKERTQTLHEALMEGFEEEKQMRENEED